MPYSWTHLVRFLAKEDGQVHLGQIDAAKVPDLGLALEKGETVTVQVVEGDVFDGVVTNRTLTISTVPLIRCMGLNYRDHAKEAGMPIPDTSSSRGRRRQARPRANRRAQDRAGRHKRLRGRAVAGHRQDRPRHSQRAGTGLHAGLYGEQRRQRTGPVAQEQPVVLFQGSRRVGSHWAGLGSGICHRRSSQAQDQGNSQREMIFDIPTTIAFLSQGTTLERGTIIMTGTGPGIGAMRTPKLSLKHEDDIRVEIEKIGTLINKVYHE